MGQLFEVVLETSFYASIVGIIIFIINKVYEEKIKPSYRYLIWMTLVVILVLPIILKSEDILLSILRDNNKINIEFYEENIDDDFINTNNSVPSNGVEVTNASINRYKNTLALEFFNMVWIVGVINIGFVFLVTHYVLKHKIRKDELEKNKDMSVIFSKCIKKLNIRRKIKVRISDVVSTPSSVGLIHPKIVIPSDMTELEDRKIEYIIFHELVHYKRCDMFVNYILITLQCIHWFNPLIWYFFKQMRKEMEISTDNKVIEIMNEDTDCKDYDKISI